MVVMGIGIWVVCGLVGIGLSEIRVEETVAGEEKRETRAGHL